MLAHAAAPLARTAPLDFTHRDRIGAERQLAQVRSQVAIVLTLADQVARMAHSTDAEGLCQQLLEEVTRLRERVALAAVPVSVREPEDSGVFPRAVAVVHTALPR